MRTRRKEEEQEEVTHIAHLSFFPCFHSIACGIELQRKINWRHEEEGEGHCLVFTREAKHGKLVVVSAPWVTGGNFVGLKCNAEIFLKIDQNRG